MAPALAGTSTALTRRWSPRTVALPLLVAGMLSAAVPRTLSGPLAGAAESWLARRMPLPLRLSGMPVAARLVAIPLPVESATGLTDREISRLPLGCLAFGARQCRTNQWPMHGPLVLATGCHGLFDVDRFNVDGLGLFRSFYCFGQKNRCVLNHVVDCVLRRDENRQLSGIDRRRRGRRDRFLPSRCGHLGVLVLVLGVTRGAACLLHLVFDHRDNRVISDTTLARTVIV